MGIEHRSNNHMEGKSVMLPDCLMPHMIADHSQAELVASIIEDAATRLRMHLSPLSTARVLTEAGVAGLMMHGDYPTVLGTVSATVAAILKPGLGPIQD
jgi:hypothetical protein